MITFDTASGRFTYRVASIAIIDGHVLVHRDPEADFWVLPGGRVEMMEPAHLALEREMLEETGLKVSVGRLVWIIENFFQLQENTHHELGLYFEISIGSNVLPDAKTFLGKEGDTELEFRWARFGELPGLGIQPAFLGAQLGNLPATTQRVVLEGQLNSARPTATILRTLKERT